MEADLLGAGGLAAQGGELEPGVGVLVHGQHQAAHRQQRLPHLVVALHAAQPLLPHLPRQRAPRLRGRLIACRCPGKPRCCLAAQNSLLSMFCTHLCLCYCCKTAGTVQVSMASSVAGDGQATLISSQGP